MILKNKLWLILVREKKKKCCSAVSSRALTDEEIYRPKSEIPAIVTTQWQLHASKLGLHMHS